MNRKDFRRARRSVEVTVGESVRIIRELQEMSQNVGTFNYRPSRPSVADIEPYCTDEDLKELQPRSPCDG